MNVRIKSNNNSKQNVLLTADIGLQQKLLPYTEPVIDKLSSDKIELQIEKEHVL